MRKNKIESAELRLNNAQIDECIERRDELAGDLQLLQKHLAEINTKKDAALNPPKKPFGFFKKTFGIIAKKAKNNVTEGELEQLLSRTGFQESIESKNVIIEHLESKIFEYQASIASIAQDLIILNRDHDSIIADQQKYLAPSYRLEPVELEVLVESLASQKSSENHGGNYLNILPVARDVLSNEDLDEYVMPEQTLGFSLQRVLQQQDFISQLEDLRQNNATSRLLIPYYDATIAHYILIKLDIAGPDISSRLSVIDPYGSRRVDLSERIVGEVNLALDAVGMSNASFDIAATERIQVNEDAKSCGFIVARMVEEFSKRDNFQKSDNDVIKQIHNANGKSAFAKGAIELREHYSHYIGAGKVINKVLGDVEFSIENVDQNIEVDPFSDEAVAEYALLEAEFSKNQEVTSPIAGSVLSDSGGSTTEEELSELQSAQIDYVLYQSCLSNFHKRQYTDAANDLLILRQDMSRDDFSGLINGGLPNTGIILGDLLSLEGRRDEAIEQYGSAIAIGGINSDGIERAYSSRIEANLRASFSAFQSTVTLDFISEKMLKSQMVDACMVDVIHDLEAIKILKGDSAEYAQYVRLGDRMQRAFGAEKYQEFLDQSSTFEKLSIENPAKTTDILFTELAAINADNIGLKLEILTQIISMDEHNVAALIAIGDCQYLETVGESKTQNQYHDKEAALANYNKALELDPENPLVAPAYRAKANELLLNTENAFSRIDNISNGDLKRASELYNKAHEVGAKGGIEEGTESTIRRARVNQAIDERGNFRNVVGIVSTGLAVAIAGSLMSNFGIDPSLIIGSSIAIVAMGGFLTSNPTSGLGKGVSEDGKGVELLNEEPRLDQVQSKPREQRTTDLLQSMQTTSHQEQIGAVETQRSVYL